MLEDYSSKAKHISLRLLSNGTIIDFGNPQLSTRSSNIRTHDASNGMLCKLRGFQPVRFRCVENFARIVQRIMGKSLGNHRKIRGKSLRHVLVIFGHLSW